MSSYYKPPFKIPIGRPQEWSPDTVIPYVKTGMMIELSTIPLYLYAMYSIKLDNGGPGTQARAAIRGIVEQEMLHLTLDGNLLSALKGSLDLYDKSVMPIYPSEILMQKVPMNLDRTSKENLDCFLQIEAPDTPRPFPDNTEPGLLPEIITTTPFAQLATDSIHEYGSEYKSIGDFYEDLEKGLRHLPDSDLAHNADKQYSGQDFFDDQMVIIKDQSTALEALTRIIEQGEGNVAVPDSHYSVFVKLYLTREAWKCYNVRVNPHTQDFKGESTHIDRGTTETEKDRAYKVALAFDVAYCYLLQTIQRVWETGKDNILLRVLLLRNIHAIMTNVVSPLAHILVNLELDDGTVAAPCFNYYPINHPPLPPQQLWNDLGTTVKSAISATPDSETAELASILAYLDKVPPFLLLN